MKNLTDEHVDNLMAMLADASRADEALVRDIADSPQLHWAVQRNIAQQKDAKRPWPPANVLFRWLAVGVPSLAALVVAIIYFGGSWVDRRIGSEPVVAVANVEPAASATTIAVNPTNESSPAEVEIARDAPKEKRPVVSRIQAAERPNRSRISSRAVDEIRSDFIALSYTGSPESGQLVRVKVPSSMMVNLGLVDSVDKPSSLVDAEVVVGDDGQTHAIRFIRQ